MSKRIKCRFCKKGFLYLKTFESLFNKIYCCDKCDYSCTEHYAQKELIENQKGEG